MALLRNQKEEIKILMANINDFSCFLPHCLLVISVPKIRHMHVELGLSLRQAGLRQGCSAASRSVVCCAVPQN